MIEAIIFDIGGVLLDQSEDRSLELVAQRFNVPIEIVKNKIYENLDLLQTAEINEKEYWIRFAEHVDRELPIDYNELWSKEFTKSRVDADVLAIVQQLRNNRYKTATLSNTINSHAIYLRRFFNDGLFDAFVLSNEIGKRKPNREAYQYVVDKLNIRPEQGVFIDDKNEFVDAAVNCGLIGVTYKNPSQLRSQLRNLCLL